MQVCTLDDVDEALTFHRRGALMWFPATRRGEVCDLSAGFRNTQDLLVERLYNTSPDLPPEGAGAASPMQLFQKVPVRPLGQVSGALSALLGTTAPKADARAADSDDDGGGGGGGDKIGVKIYLPDCTPVVLQVSRQATVTKVIRALLRMIASAPRPSPDGARAAAQRRGPPLSPDQLAAFAAFRSKLPLDPGCFELRLHEGEGMPDNDFPALDADLPVSNFNDDDDAHEYCLALVEGGISTAASEGASLLEQAALRRRASSLSGSDVGAAGPPHGNLIQIKCENEYVKRPVGPEVTLEQLLKEVAERLNVQSGVPYVFMLADEDAAALKRPTAELDMLERVGALGVKVLLLKRKTFVDAPRAQRAAASANPSRRSSNVTDAMLGAGSMIGASAGIGAAGAGSAAGAGAVGSPLPARRVVVPAFTFNNVSAALYKEWVVIKTNNRGKRQKRVLGVDQSSVYNRKMDGNWGIKSVKRPERNMTEVLNAYLHDDNPNCFSIVYQGGNSAGTAPGTTTIEYEAERPEDAAEIVAKLHYLRANAQYIHGSGK